MLTFNTVNKNNNLHTYKCICTNERTISEIKLTYFFLKDDGPDAGIYDSTEDGIFLEYQILQSSEKRSVEAF